MSSASASASSNRSSSVPLSFDRFRLRSFQFPSLFHHHSCEKRMKTSPERPKIRKTQVRPDDTNLSESSRIIYDASYLFRANKQSAMTASSPSLIQNSQNKIYPSNFFNTQPTSNVGGVLDCKNLSLINPSYSKHAEAPDCVCPPTPCMIRYRQCSVPAVITTRIIKHPMSFDQLNKKPH